jgi:hypothetical protein
VFTARYELNILIQFRLTVAFHRVFGSADVHYSAYDLDLGSGFGGEVTLLELCDQ